MHGPRETAWIVERARELGFALCGVAPLQKFAEHEAFAEWLERGYAGEMAYLADARRSHPEKVLDAAGSVIVCALTYNTALPYSNEALHGAAANGNEEEAPRGWISRYAWGRDYHEVLWERLNALLKLLTERFQETHFSRAYADTGPVAERIFAKYAGLGWIGKNTLLLNEKLGSWFFLGVIVTSLDLAPSLAAGEMPPADLCGNCRQCLDACPTQALIEPYVMDARRCISYLTIELRGGIPTEFREAMGRHVYGCDVCQEVCPYNREAPVTEIADFAPRSWRQGESLLDPSLEWLAGMSEEEFREKFRGSAMKRTKWRGLVRNACIALGNAKPRPGSGEHGRIVKLLERLTSSAEPAIAESAQWALCRIR
jgi:epoxyqueuosine reductase